MRLPEALWANYEFRARILPALIAVALPIGLVALGLIEDSVVGLSTVTVTGIALLAALSLGAVAAQLGRDRGKKKEAGLFSQWGGVPTTAMLRHGDNRISAITKERYRRKLEVLLPDLRLPSLTQESSDPRGADEVYSSCTAFLREATRDREKYHLIFSESCSYGFRRNLWGLKPIALVSTAVPVARGAWQLGRDGATFFQDPLGPLTLACAICLLCLWLFVVTPSWIKVAADAYAERLLASCDSFESERG